METQWMMVVCVLVCEQTQLQLPALTSSAVSLANMVIKSRKFDKKLQRYTFLIILHVALQEFRTQNLLVVR